MTNDIFRKYLQFLLGIVLILSPLVRFSWDIYQQTLLHILIISSFIYIVLNSKLDINRKYAKSILPLLLLPLLTMFSSFQVYLARNEYLVLLSSILAGFLFTLLPAREKLKMLWIPVVFAFWYALIVIIYNIFNIKSGLLPLEFIVNYAVLSSFLLLVFPLSFLEQFREHKGWIIIPIVIFTGILLTKSRVSIILSLFTIITISKYYKVRVPSYLKYLYIPVLLFIIYITLIKGYILSERIIWWKTAIKMFIDNPFFGVGWGNYAVAYPVYKIAARNSTLFAHNIFFQLIAELGVFGVLFFIFILNITFNNLFRSKTSEYLPIKLSIISFFTLNLFDYTFYIFAHMLLFFILLSFFVENKIASINTGRIKRYFSVIIIVIPVAYLLMKPSISAYYYQKGNAGLNKGDIENSAVCFHKSIQYDKYNPNNHSKLAELYTYKYAITKSEIDIEKAIENQVNAANISPKTAVFWFDLSWLYLIKGDRLNADKSIRQALKLDVNNKKYKSVKELYLDD